MDGDTYNDTYGNQTGNGTVICVEMDIPSWLHFGLMISLVLLIVLCFLTKRSNNRCRNCCWGRPALVIPVNLLDASHDRWAFACAFGSISNFILNFFLNSGQFFPTQSIWLKVLATLLGALEICVVFMPFFACLNTNSTILAPFIGFLYSAGWFVVIVIFTLACTNPIPTMVPLYGVISELPTLICLFFVVVNFLRLTGLGIYRMCCQGDQPHAHSQLASGLEQDYVRHLFAKPVEIKPTSMAHRGRGLVMKHLMANKKYFQFSTRIICTLFITALCLFQLFLVVYAIRNEILMYVDFLAVILEMPDLTAAIGVLFHIIMWVAFLLGLVQILFIFRKYRLHTLMLYRGDRSFIAPGYAHSNVNKQRLSMLFSGYQIAYMIWGFVIFSVIAFIVGTVLCVIIIIPAMLGEWEFIWMWAQGIIASVVVAFVLRVIQILLGTFVFLQSKLHTTDADRPLAITNRRIYHFTNYFFFLANIAIGLFSAINRILLGTVGGFLFLGRLDRSVLMSGLETRDTGHMAYLGTLMLETAHNHPVLRVFCHQLLGATRAKSADHSKSKLSNENSSAHLDQFGNLEEVASGKGVLQQSRLQLVRNRWHLAYTLLKNPGLVKQRMDREGLSKHQRQEKSLLLFMAQQNLFAELRQKYESLEEWKTKLEKSYALEQLVKERADDIYSQLVSEKAYECNDLVSASDGSDDKGAVFNDANDVELKAVTNSKDASVKL